MIVHGTKKCSFLNISSRKKHKQENLQNIFRHKINNAINQYTGNAEEEMHIIGMKYMIFTMQ